MLKTINDLKEKVKTLYAGRVAESLILKDNITVGASNDIMQASKLIKDMVTIYGMSTDNKMLNYEIISDDKLVATEVTKISAQLYSEIEELLTINKPVLEDIANALLEQETLYEEDVDKILYLYDTTRDLVDLSKYEKSNESKTTEENQNNTIESV